MQPPTHQALDALQAASGELAAQADLSAEQRSLSDAGAKILRDTGVMRLIQPARYGGYEADPRTFVEACMLASRYDGAAGWVIGVVGVHNYHIGLYDDRVQREVWGDDPDRWVSSSYNFKGKAEAVDGGYRLTGRWGFSSGCQHADWVFVGGFVHDEQGRPVQMRHFLLPRDDYEIVDVWRVAGLSGTGSNDIVADGAFVPEYHSMSVDDLRAHRCPGLAVNHAPVFRVPWGTMFLNAVSAPLVGMAEGLLAGALGLVKNRLQDYLPPPGALGAAPSPFDHRLIWPAVSLARLAEASAEIDAARLQLFDNLADAYAHAVAGEPVPLTVRARARRDQVMATKRAVDAADAIFSVAGGRALSLRSPLQRLWRDVHAGAHHVVNGTDQALTTYGAYLMGEPIDDQLI